VPPLLALVLRVKHPGIEVALSLAAACALVMALANARGVARYGQSLGLAATSLRIVPERGTLGGIAVARLVASAAAPLLVPLFLAITEGKSDGVAEIALIAFVAPYVLNALLGLSGRTLLDRSIDARVVVATPPAADGSRGVYRSAPPAPPRV
jgi:hypothetical protein